MKIVAIRTMIVGAVLLAATAGECLAQEQEPVSARDAVASLATEDRRHVRFIYATSGGAPMSARADSMVVYLRNAAETSPAERNRIDALILLTRFAGAGNDNALETVLAVWDRELQFTDRLALVMGAGKLPDDPRVVSRLEAVMLARHADATLNADAVQALAEIGPRGRAVLREVHAENRRLPGAGSAQLRLLVERGFPVDSIRR